MYYASDNKRIFVHVSQTTNWNTDNHFKGILCILQKQRYIQSNKSNKIYRKNIIEKSSITDSMKNKLFKVRNKCTL